MPDPRAGYTLPVFACAAAIASLRHLYDPQPITTVTVDLIKPPESAEIPIEQVATLRSGMALAIARSDPGDNLDLTRDTPIWAVVEWAPSEQSEAITIKGGEGIGFDQNRGDAAVYTYAQMLLQTNLQQYLRQCQEPDPQIQVTIILPEGRALAQRTSNAAFGVIEGLALLGTAGIAQPLSSPDQLAQFQEQLQQKAEQTDSLVFCLGENGLDLARQWGIPEQCLIKTANWLGPMLVAAGQRGLASVLLLGYHGKLLKLAGGIFHTHHHLADARQEILTAYAAEAGLPLDDLHQLFQSETAEAGLQFLRSLNNGNKQNWADAVYALIVKRIDQRAQAYVKTHCGGQGDEGLRAGCDRTLQIGSALFDRSRTLFALSRKGHDLLQQLIPEPLTSLNVLSDACSEKCSGSGL